MIFTATYFAFNICISATLILFASKLHWLQDTMRPKPITALLGVYGFQGD